VTILKCEFFFNKRNEKRRVDCFSISETVYVVDLFARSERNTTTKTTNKQRETKKFKAIRKRKEGRGKGDRKKFRKRIKHRILNREGGKGEINTRFYYQKSKEKKILKWDFTNYSEVQVHK
jgi:hypothetical protein